ncbi:MAG: DUF2155 domain-containing protein [Pseudomonadota bacterium]
MQRVLILWVIFGMAGTTPAISQQNQSDGQGFSGQVLSSPVPRVRVLRPGESPSDVEVAPQQDRDITQPDEDEASTGDIPKVVRLGGSRDDEQSTTKDPDGAPEQQSDQPPNNRFKKAPERQSTFKPDEVVMAVPLSSPSTRLKNGARLRQLDKMTGLIRTYDVSVGETVRVARLRVRLDACRSPGDNDTHGTMAFLKVWDTKYETPDPEFSGWMFAESPALSALDHPRYDLWVINCTTPLGE